MRHFLQYWKVDQADVNRGSPLDHAASAQYHRVSPGDMLWVVTIRDHRFKLLGRLRVEKIVNQKEAKRLRGKGIYPAKLHALAVPNTVEFVSEIDIQDLAKMLRFKSGRDRLALNDAGSVDGKQIQTLREVTPESARLLSERWGKRSAKHVVPHEPGDPTRLETGRAGAFGGSPEENREVESAAVSHVTREYMQKGWNVKSVEQDKCGYDLLCTKGSIEEHVEVKGIRGPEGSFIITAGEVRSAGRDANHVFCIVTKALDKPHTLRFTGAEFLGRYELEPLSFRATPSRLER